MKHLYINNGFTLEQVTANRLLALQAIKQELESGYDATCYLDDLDPENKFEIQDELDNWARDIPTWSIGTFFESHEI